MIQEYLSEHQTQTATSNDDGSDAYASPMPAEQRYVWGGRFHAVPENFNFPATTVKVLWDSWLFGNSSLSIGPYLPYIGV